jgi:peptidylprolyl isomerase
MLRAKAGDTVRIHYTGKLDDGKVVDSSHDREPFEFTIGAGQVIPGVEQAVTGMEPGESKSAEIPPEQAYGPHRDGMVVTVERTKLPAGLEVAVGEELALRQDDGRQLSATVTDVSDQGITIDANHKLAGRTLVFDLQLLEVL